MSATMAAELQPEDLDRLAVMSNTIAASDSESVLKAAIPSLTESERDAIARHSSLSHAAVVVFPRTLDGLSVELARHDIEVGAITPSVVVRNRLSKRYRVRVSDLRVDVLRAPVLDRTGRTCELEIFAVATPPALAHIAEDERLNGWENHVAMSVTQPDPVVLNGLLSTIATWMTPDGGGHNAHENSTVLYFRGQRDLHPAFRRLELICTGLFPEVLAGHLRQSDNGAKLLRLLSGAWATQAVSTAVELRLPDLLVEIPDLAGLAEATEAHQDSLSRLLRYLTNLGLVDKSAKGYTLTELGSLLRADFPGSMRPLALMYGGPVYQSFASLTDAVRTGEESYKKVFGAHHFDHMAADAELAEMFHQSMAASSAMFAEVARVIDFSRVRTVVDVAGGNGELLSQVLKANPSLHGVLVERPHALAAAKPNLSAVSDRCALVPGDFTKEVPNIGDMYVLSRVLHDWDDNQCHRILATCAANMPDHAELLIIERLLPNKPDPYSLAIPWDIHMLCNVGGRERTESHYRALLTDAGFELVDSRALPLDAFALRGRKLVSSCS
ncbi:methyltransferase [Kibdelosporangium aridum]|uniref:methyltransferase n=1 Tax=Kibdelosporangium aridum TaxID=2030 RepID=UPI000526DCEE